MDVILKQDLANLGFKNDVVSVKDGYGRNYLIPNKFAIIANEVNLKQLKENLKQQAHKLQKMLEDAQALASQLKEVIIDIPVKANEKGRIFGAVTTAQISEALEKQGIKIDKKVITVDPIKEIGPCSAFARLHREVKAEIKLNVINKNQKKN